MKDQTRLILMSDTNMSTTSDHAKTHKNIKKIGQGNPNLYTILKYLQSLQHYTFKICKKKHHTMILE